MLKHPAISIKRATQWKNDQLTPQAIHALRPLAIEMCPVAHPDQATAEREGPWQSVEPGQQWGPAYSVRWFRLSGALTSDEVDQSPAFRAPLGGERTWWVGNVPERGIDGEHPVIPLTTIPLGSAITEEKGVGARVQLVIQAYATAPHVRVFGDMPAPEPLVETVKACDLVSVDRELQSLIYDVEFVLSLLGHLPDNDPGYATLVRALNDAVNAWAESGRASVTRSRKWLKDALGGLTAELKHTIYPFGHAHLDTAWLWPIRITELKMAHTASTQLYLMSQYPQYVYVHSQASQYEWVETKHPVLFERIKAASERGQWEPIGSMWVEADCNLTGAESLVRQFLYGKRYFQKHFGIETKDMFLPDVFGYSAALPQILHKLGIRYFLTQKISWNQFNKFPHNTFWWQGIDGTKIWTHFPPADTYIGSCEPEEIARSVKQHRDQARSDHSMYLFGWGDGGGGPTERHLELLQRARTAPYLPDIERGKSARDFYAEARAKSRDLITWVGELYLEGHRGTYTSQAANKAGNRESEFLLRDAEWLHSFSPTFPDQYPALKIERLWKTVLLNQFHDIIPGSSVREVYEDSDQDYAHIRDEGNRLVDDALESIAARMDTSQQSAPIALFHNATVASEASVTASRDDVQSVEVGSERYPVQRVHDTYGDRYIFETPAEALGAVAIGSLSRAPSPARQRLKSGNRKLENDMLSVRFDAHGNISSISMFDDEALEMIEPGRLANMFQLFDDHPMFWEAWDVDPYLYETGQDLVRSERFEVVERGPVRVAVEVEKRFGNSLIRQRISLGPTPGIRFDTFVDWRESRKMLKVAFPLNVNAARATYEIQFGHVERPTHKNTSWDLAKFEVCAQKWADLSEGGYGAAIINRGKYGYDTDGNVLRLSLLRSPKAPDPLCDMGEHRFTYVLLPHFGAVQQSEVVAAAYAINAPVRTKALTPKSGNPGQLNAFIEVNRRDVVIEAVKKAEDSDRLIVRLYECHNTRGRATLRCIRPIKRAWVANLMEELDHELEVSADGVNFEYKPFEIITICLEV
jgi:alpha-mannosidase